MFNRYLKGNPLPWLTDGSDRSVTSLALREFKNEITDYPDSHLYSDDLTPDSLKQINPVNNGSIDIFYRGTLWHFLLAGESGLNVRIKSINDAALFLDHKISASDGGFSFHTNPLISTGCRTGNMVKAMIRSGYSSDRIEKGISWILKNQRQDGGWLHCPYSGTCDSIKLMFFKKPGKGLESENDLATKSCPVATAACSLALIEADLFKHKEAVNRGAEFFLSHLSLYERKRFILQCGQSITLERAGYPVMTQVDPVSLLLVIFSSDYWDDKRATSLFSRIMKMQKSGGIWESENNYPGMIRGKGADRWVTLNVLRMLKILAIKENQLSKA